MTNCTHVGDNVCNTGSKRQRGPSQGYAVVATKEAKLFIDVEKLGSIQGWLANTLEKRRLENLE